MIVMTVMTVMTATATANETTEIVDSHHRKMNDGSRTKESQQVLVLTAEKLQQALLVPLLHLCHPRRPRLHQRVKTVRLVHLSPTNLRTTPHT